MATRTTLVELASDMFSTEGYLQTSIRDIANAAGLTTGAIYGHFRSKADLLAEAISARTVSDLESVSMGGEPPSGGTASHVAILRRLSERYPERRQLRALILQGAAAAVTDAETRDRLRAEQLAHLQAWIDGYEEYREALGIDPAVDIRDAVLYTWAVELGLGVLEALEIAPRSKKSWGEMAARFAQGLTLSPPPTIERDRGRRRSA